jgi:ATP-binding cassette subfamily F protein 3
LDVSAREALESSLLGYEGTMLFVSHDRYFIDKLATVIYELDGTTLRRYEGGYNAYLSAKKPTEVKTEQVKDKSDYIRKKQFDSDKRKLETAIKKGEEQISILEKEIATLTSRLYGAEGQDYLKAQVLSEQIEEKQEKLSVLLDKWEKDQIALEQLIG